MKKIFFVLPLLFALTLISCKKEDPEPEPEEDYRTAFSGDFHFTRTYKDDGVTDILEWDGSIEIASRYQYLLMDLANGDQQLLKVSTEGNLKLDDVYYGNIEPNGDLYRFWDHNYPSGVYVSYRLQGERL